MEYQDLFNYMHKMYGLILIQSEMDAIIGLCRHENDEDEDEQTQPLQQSLVSGSLPLQTKLEMFYDFLFERGIANQIGIGIDTIVKHFIDEMNKEYGLIIGLCQHDNDEDEDEVSL